VSGGMPAPQATALPGDPGYALHAAEISFDHPEGAGRISVAARLPEGLRCSDA
jgi:23S rRNA-/tRNA-specific pseudouridylate synthase